MEGPYRDDGSTDDGLFAKVKKDRGDWLKAYCKLEEEFFEYKQKCTTWQLMLPAVIVLLGAMYWALLLDMRHWVDTMEPKHVCDPAPACELKLHVPLDSSQERH